MKKKVWIPLVTLASLIVVGLLMITLSTLVWRFDSSVSVSQIEQTQNIEVKWQLSSEIDSMEIIVKHNSGKKVFSTKIKDKDEILKGKYTIPVFYGRHNVTVKMRNKLYSTKKTIEIKVFADEYNIAPLTGTMPVTIFSLSLMDKDNGITKNGSIPTFVWFKRSEAWNYDEMPENVFTMPVASNKEIRSNSEQDVIYEKTSAWIKELYEINPSSFFNLFYNDYLAYGWMQATIGNDIPDVNYKVVLLSDGTASFELFNNHFDNENHDNEYAKMLRRYTLLKKQIKREGTYEELNDNFVVPAIDSSEYAFLMVKEEKNVEWWLTRISGTLAPNTPSQYSEISDLEDDGKIKVTDLKNLLNALSEDEKVNLKKLYSFSDTMFEKASEENKKVMVILGTWISDEVDFDGYVRAVQSYYGEDYIYYYKGHPKNPTNSVKGRLEYLNSLGLTDVDSTIPAELIFFFNPEACGVGYQSTTFVSLTDEQSGGVFAVRKDDFDKSLGYFDKLEFFITKLNKNDESFGNLTLNGTSFLFEFTKTDDFDIAIFNKENSSLKFYKKQKVGDIIEYEEVSV